MKRRLRADVVYTVQQIAMSHCYVSLYTVWFPGTVLYKHISLAYEKQYFCYAEQTLKSGTKEE